MFSAKPFEDFLPEGSVIMFELLFRIHFIALPLMNLLSNLELKATLYGRKHLELPIFRRNGPISLKNRLVVNGGVFQLGTPQ